jgi:hypothetical protein
MYRLLFDLAGLAMIGWLLLILLPGWKVTRRIAETAIFPIYLALLYLVGLTAVLAENGPGFMADFGSADGVLGLLQLEPVALVAWIHILAFDQVVGLLIYRDNLKYRIVPLPVQSLILLATLMLGPIGFLSYWGIRVLRRRDPAHAWGEAEPAPAPVESPLAPPVPAIPAAAPRFSSVATGTSPVGVVLALWRRNPGLLWLGLTGFAFATVTTGVAAVNGGWMLAPEGRLLEAVKFDVAVGIYVLTLALIVPFAPFTERGRRRWVSWSVGLGLFGYGMENIQAWRGLDPRFSAVAGPVDQVLGGLFFFSALGLLVLFVILLVPFFRADALPDHTLLRLALRYGAGGTLLAFGVGILMSVINSRIVAGSGDIMPVHAAGFHALQAVPLVALLLGASAGGLVAAGRLVHLAGAGWLLLGIGLTLQAFSGQPPLALTPPLALAAAGVATWATTLVIAWRGRTVAAAALAGD